jgi:hypothetical protein
VLPPSWFDISSPQGILPISGLANLQGRCIGQDANYASRAEIRAAGVALMGVDWPCRPPSPDRERRTSSQQLVVIDDQIYSFCIQHAG